MKMKYLAIACLSAIFLVSTFSCVDYIRPEFDVEKPESIAEVEYLKTYDVLNSYIDRAANPDFKLGSGVSTGDYAEQGLVYSLISSNFDEVAAGYSMKHGSNVQDDGTIDLAGVVSFVSAAKEAGVGVYGHTLCWHANQNATYLNSTIAPEVIPGSGVDRWDTIKLADFESDGISVFTYSNSIASITAEGEGANSEGKAIKIVNEEVRADEWGSQFFVAFDPMMEEGERYILRMDIRADDPCSVNNQAHTTPGVYLHWDFFGAINFTSEWTTFVKEITVSDLVAGTRAIAFNLGPTATSYYVDNFTLEKFTSGGETLIEKPDAEKKEIISNELERWINGMMEVTSDYIKAWDVVNEPMDDGNPSELKSGVGRDLEADQFYWQDVLGKDYAVMAFNLARQYGNEDDILFINDYNLEYNLDKCQGIIDYVAYIESKGAVVDGIGTQMHISTNSDKQKIADMFSMLAATGKLIKVSELDVGVGAQTTEATEENYIAQAEMYEYVVSKYMELIPAAQRYGITVWSPFDSPRNSFWRAGEPIGLWTESYQRKRAYAAFADALKNSE